MYLEKKILILTTSYLPMIGGSEIAIQEIAQRLSEIQFDIVSGRYDERHQSFEENGSIHVYRVRGGAVNFLVPKIFLPLAIFFKAVSLLWHNKYDAIHAYQASQAAGAACFLKWIFPRVPFVLTLQEGKELAKQHWLIQSFRKLIIHKANYITVISQYLKDYVHSVLPDASVSIIPNGVDLKKFKNTGDRALIRQQLGFSSEDKIIITVGRLVSKNGLANLVESIAMLSIKIPQIKLIFVGSGQMESDLRDKIQKLNLGNKVRFLGEVSHDDLPKYLSMADLFVRPSLSEGLGNSFLEAMACGLPVLGTAVGGIPDFIENGKTGIFCDPKNPADIADKISMILNDSVLTARLSQNARVQVENKYDWVKIANQMGLIYQNL